MALLFVGTGLFLFSAPVENPAVPRSVETGFLFSGKWFSFRLGYEGDFVSNRRLKDTAGPRIEDFSQNCNSGFLVLNLLNRLDLYGLFGQAAYKSDWILTVSATDFARIEMETSYKDRWGLGFNAIFLEWGDVTLAVGGRYAKTDPQMLWLSKDAITYKPSTPVFSYEEWQLDIAISYKIDFFIPYIAAKYSHADVKLRTPGIIISSENTDQISMKNRDNYGAAFGCGLTNGKYFHLNGEIRLFDEEAFTISGEFRF